MNERTPNRLGGTVEKIHSFEEVIELLESVIKKEYRIVRRLSDEDGLYLLQAEMIGEDGDRIVYTYGRAGNYPEGNSTDTVIDVIFYSGNEPVGGSTLMKYIKGRWVMEFH